MTEAHRMVAAQFGNALTPAQEAYLTAILYNRMEQDRMARNIAAGQEIAAGSQNAGQIIAGSGRQSIPQFAPLPPITQTPYIPQPMTNYQIDTPRYQLFNGASPGQIHY